MLAGKLPLATVWLWPSAATVIVARLGKLYDLAKADESSKQNIVFSVEHLGTRARGPHSVDDHLPEPEVR